MDQDAIDYATAAGLKVIAEGEFLCEEVEKTLQRRVGKRMKRKVRDLFDVFFDRFEERDSGIVVVSAATHAVGREILGVENRL